MTNNKNSLILLSITLITLSLSGFLFYKGLKDAFKSQVLITRQNPSPTITHPKISTQSATTSPKNQFKVLKVIDGDTIQVYYHDKITSVRFIGIDTPETLDPRRPVGCFGKEASDETKRLLSDKTITLEKDVSETDKYDRILRYVYLPLDDGNSLFVNDYLVRQGFAHISTYPPDVKFDKRFLDAQKEARDNNRGLWSSCK